MVNLIYPSKPIQSLSVTLNSVSQFLMIFVVVVVFTTFVKIEEDAS